MAINDRMRAICEDEEKKFYRGEDSMIDKCNLSCITVSAERQIVLYVSVRTTVVKICVHKCVNSFRVTSVAAEGMVK